MKTKKTKKIKNLKPKNNKKIFTKIQDLQSHFR